jgi:hypothetical protein
MKNDPMKQNVQPPGNGPQTFNATGPLPPELLHKINAYWRAANYLSVGQIYICTTIPCFASR